MIRFLLGALCLLTCASGCISEQQGSEKDAPSWRIGVTKPRDVVAVWGNPDFVQGESWVWWDVNAIGGKVRASYMMLGLTISNSQRFFSGYRLTFSSGGTLSSIEGYETIPGGGKWSVIPW